MEAVRILRVASAHPPGRVSQGDAAALIGRLCGQPRRVAALARGTRIQQRAVVLPPEELAALGDIEARNRVYQEFAPTLAQEAAAAALGEAPRDHVAALVTTSCTGYSVPGWAVALVANLGLPASAVRLPITESGCAGGVVGLAHAAALLRSRPGPASALAVSAELCSLAFHAGGDEGNITSTLIFGDGAGAALLQSGAGAGLRIIDSASLLVPDTAHLLGFDLTGHGFYPVLKRELVDALPPALEAAAGRLLARNGLSRSDVGAWLLHPGGARILASIEARLGIARERTRWSWEAMRDAGNTSSAAIFNVLARYMESPAASPIAVVAAFGPGVAIELLLLERS